MPALALALKDPDDRVRRLAAEVLARVGPAASPAAPALLALLNRANREIRDQVAGSLAVPRPEARTVESSLSNAFATHLREAARGRTAAIAAFRSIGGPALEGLFEALGSRDPHLRASALDVLRRLEPEHERSIPIIARVLGGDPDPRVRLAAAKALQDLGYSAALVEALRDGDPDVRAAAAYAIERTGGLQRWEAVIALVERLEDEFEEVREAAYYALDHRADEGVLTLAGKLRHPDAEVRRRAAEVFAAVLDYPRIRVAADSGDRFLSWTRDEASAPLEAALTDVDPGVRKAAQKAVAILARRSAEAPTPSGG